MIVKLLTEHHFELLSLTGGCTGSSESTHVKMPHCWKSHALVHLSCAQAMLKTHQQAHALILSLGLYLQLPALTVTVSLNESMVCNRSLLYRPTEYSVLGTT